MATSVRLVYLLNHYHRTSSVALARLCCVIGQEGLPSIRGMGQVVLLTCIVNVKAGYGAFILLRGAGGLTPRHNSFKHTPQKSKVIIGWANTLLATVLPQSLAM